MPKWRRRPPKQWRTCRAECLPTQQHSRIQTAVGQGLALRRALSLPLWGRLPTCWPIVNRPPIHGYQPAAVSNRRAGCHPAPHGRLRFFAAFEESKCNTYRGHASQRVIVVAQAVFACESLTRTTPVNPPPALLIYLRVLVAQPLLNEAVEVRLALAVIVEHPLILRAHDEVIRTFAG
jgi:hypothetical protein